MGSFSFTPKMSTVTSQKDDLDGVLPYQKPKNKSTSLDAGFLELPSKSRCWLHEGDREDEPCFPSKVATRAPGPQWQRRYLLGGWRHRCRLGEVAASLAFISKKKERTYLKSYIFWWHNMGGLIFRAFVPREAPQMKQAEVVHARWVHRDLPNMSLLETYALYNNEN